ncbi:MAG: Mn2+/Fe2+ NRAMP family transporter [Limisphaerales bacterium]|jgi:Mn2+/Fe2+ NRAMP family transporter
MNYSKFGKVLGPGLLFASMAIGVSHLVQTTRAGANYGFALILIVIAANLFKYPFFEYASRYANATGESIIDGYNRLGKLPIWLYFIATCCTMFFVMAGVGFVTVGFMDNLFGLSALWPSFTLFPTLLLFIICCSILYLGKFKALDGLIKVVGIVLFISTSIAFILTLLHGPIEKVEGFQAPELFNETGILFMIALMGWMPTALDISTWNSLWTIEKIKTTGYYPTLKETLFEFNLGYWIAAGLALFFLTMGAFLMYGSGVEMPAGSGAFSSQVVTLYTSTIGDWSYLIISASAFSVMFGTSIAVFDGYARTLERVSEILFLSTEKKGKNNSYNWALAILAIGAFILIALFLKHFKLLIDIATTLSFIIAPLVAIANMKLVSNKYIKEEATPPRWLKILSYAGIIFLSSFTLFFLYIKLF